MVRILVIDDQPDNLTVLSSVLKDLILDSLVITASSGAEGIEKAENEAPDTILLDIIMPEMDGFEVCRRLKSNKKTSHIPVVMMTAIRTDSQSRIKGLELGADAFLSKPIDESELAAQIKVMLRIKMAEDKLRQQKNHLEDLVLERVEELRKSEEKYQDLYDNAPDMCISVDLKTNIIRECNQTLVKATGYSKEEIIGRSIFDLYTPESVALVKTDVLPIFLLTGKIEGEELQLQRKDGSTIDVSLNGSVVRDTGGNIKYSRSSWRDITEKKRLQNERLELERQLQQVQKLEAIGTLAGGIAHDFNNILHPIMGYANMGLKKTNDKEELAKYFNIILDSSKRAKDLVQQILTFSRQGKQELRPLQLQPVIKEVLKMLRSSLPSTIEIKQKVDESCGLVMADATKIHQIIMNLGTNAFHAMQETGGELTIALESKELTSEDLKDSNLPPDIYVCLRVSDTGTGIRPEIVERIFDPYFTTKEKGKGTGLGLSVVAGLVRSFAGTITVKSEYGGGTEFKVCLPQVTLEEKSSESVAEFPETGGQERILLVDDEASIAQLEKEILEQLGYKVTVRTSSLEALEVIKAQPDDFDLVITDMTMPHMTGEKLARQILHIKPEMPIIICTGYSELISQQQVETLGIRKLLMKPIVPGKFAYTIRQVLDGD